MSFDYHRGGIHNWSPTGVSETAEALCSNSIIRMIGCDPVFNMLAPHRSKEINWFRYGDDVSQIIGYDVYTEQVPRVPLLGTTTNFKRGFSILVDISGNDPQRVQEIQFASIVSSRSQWQGFGSVLCSQSGPKVLIIEHRWWMDCSYSFEKASWRTRDSNSAIPELQKDCGR